MCGARARSALDCSQTEPTRPRQKKKQDKQQSRRRGQQFKQSLSCPPTYRHTSMLYDRDCFGHVYQGNAEMLSGEYCLVEFGS
jgi:hypothetical protein